MHLRPIALMNLHPIAPMYMYPSRKTGRSDNLRHTKRRLRVRIYQKNEDNNEEIKPDKDRQYEEQKKPDRMENYPTSNNEITNHDGEPYTYTSREEENQSPNRNYEDAELEEINEADK